MAVRLLRQALGGPALLTRFAIDHCWFNRQNRLEWGEYFNYNNVRLPKSQIAPIVKKYFDLDISPSHDPPYMDYKNGYYYWQETGGHTNDGFACLDRVEALGWNRYSVWFNIYGMGEAWTNDMCYYTQAQARSIYPVASALCVGGLCYNQHVYLYSREDNMEKIRTTVRIAGKDYTIASYDSEDYVNRVAAWVDRRMDELAAATKLPAAQLAVLTAVNAADDMMKSRDEIRRLKAGAGRAARPAGEAGRR